MFHINKKYIVDLSLLLFITILFRLPVFFLSHNNNDELIHLSLAMKIDKYGLNVFKNKQYSLFYIERGFSPDIQLTGVLSGNNKVGSLLGGFLGEREEVSHHPPLVPFFIALSHKIFANNLIYLVNISGNIYSMIRNFTFQFYACIVPFLFSLFFILSVYLLGSIFFSHKVGLVSALFLSLTPTELMTANKIWADDMVAFFVTLAIIFYLYALKNNKPIFFLLAGLSCGASILTKMNGIYIIFVVLLFHLAEHRKDEVNLKNLKSLFFDRNILYFLAGVFIISAWWFDLYYLAFNIRWSKYYFSVKETWESAKTWNSFFNIVSNRPWFSYFVLIPFQFPLYLLSYIFVFIFIHKNKIKSLKVLIGEEYRYLQFLVIWMVAVFVFLTLKPGKELRYMLISYPAISILSAYCLKLCYEWLRNKGFGLNQNLLRLFFISIIFVSLIFSLKISLPRILFRADIISIPF